MILDVDPRLFCLYRMRSEGVPFIVWGFGGWTLVRLEWLVASSLALRRRRVVNSMSMGEAAKPLLFEGSKQKQVVMLFCVAGAALCYIPTCLITCRKCQNWRTSRTKCSFCCADVFRLESLVFPCLVSSLWEVLCANFVVQSSTGTCPL